MAAGLQFIPEWCGLSWCQMWGLEQRPSRQGPYLGGATASQRREIAKDEKLYKAIADTPRTQRLVSQCDGRGGRAASGTEKGLLEGLAGNEVARGSVPGQGTAHAKALRHE